MTKLVSCLITYCCFSISVFAAKVDTLVVQSKIMNKNIKNVVITPDDYKLNGHPYSVVYLLHGAGGNHKAWLNKAPEIKKYADLYNVILVCPDGHKTSWYFDSPIDKKMQYETYVSKELIAQIDRKYNTVPNAKNRAITGYSMGGHGALYLGFKHPEIWGAMASMSGGVDIRPFPFNWDLSKRLGTYSENKNNWETNTIINMVYLLKNKRQKILFDCGVDDFFYEANVRLHKKLLERNISHDYIERPGGHTNAYWKNAIKYHLLFFKDFFNNTNK